MDDVGLSHVELQFVWDKELGVHTPTEVQPIKDLPTAHNKPVSCLSRYVFAGLTTANRPGDAAHTQHMDALKRVMALAHTLGGPLVRIMTNKVD